MNPMSKEMLSVIIPSYNEALNIQSITEKIEEALDRAGRTRDAALAWRRTLAFFAENLGQ